MPICSAAINAHLQPRNLRLASTTVEKGTGDTPSMSSSPLREYTAGDGWMDESMPRHACFLHLVTTVSVLSRALACYTTAQRHFSFLCHTELIAS